MSREFPQHVRMGARNNFQSIHNAFPADDCKSHWDIRSKVPGGGEFSRRKGESHQTCDSEIVFQEWERVPEDIICSTAHRRS